jgi:hypothetical protein
MHGRMKTCCHKTFTRMKKESKKCSKKRRKQKKNWFRICGQCTNACANCDGKDYKNHTSLSQKILKF